jgi:predicted Zn-dependent protease
VLALCASLPLAAIGQNQLPDFGDPASSTLSPADEREIGALLMRQIRAYMPVIDDPEIEGYIQSLGYNLLSGGTQGSTDFYFFVIADPAINAFAMPGGYIGINSGLITSAESESEVASVVAHEIAHVTQRHIARAIAASEGTQYATLAAVIAGLIIGTQNSEAGQAAVAGAAAAGAQSQLNFTRSNEKEADRVGIGMLAKAGYDPRAMPTFFEKMHLASRYYSRPPEFLSTHPVTTSRIADSRSRAEQYPYKQIADSASFGLTRAKLNVLTSNNLPRLLAIYEAERGASKAHRRVPRARPFPCRTCQADALGRGHQGCARDLRGCLWIVSRQQAAGARICGRPVAQRPGRQGAAGSRRLLAPVR